MEHGLLAIGKGEAEPGRTGTASTAGRVRVSGPTWKEGETGEKGNLSTCQESTRMTEAPAPLSRFPVPLYPSSLHWPDRLHGDTREGPIRICRQDTGPRSRGGSGRPWLGDLEHLSLWEPTPCRGGRGAGACCGAAPSPIRGELDGDSAPTAAAWKLKWREGDSEATEVPKADGFL